MSARPVLLALLAAGLAAGYAVAATLASGEAGGGPEGARAEMVGVFAWREDWEGFGGFSGLALSPDGLSFTALSDRALLVTGRLGRDAAGAVTAVEVEGRARLLDTEGGPLRGLRADSEDVAVAPDGTVFISFEGSARVRAQGPDGANPHLLPLEPAWEGWPLNASLEALALLPDDAPLVIPEVAEGGAFPVWRLRGEAWEVAFRLSRRGSFDVTGASVGPDGLLYVLERAVGLGFASRVRRVGLDGTGEETVWESRMGQRDNLEGIAAWGTASDVRLSLISDDNFRFFQSTEIVDLRVPPAP